jgi:nicotinamidase-related amidase
MKKVAIILAGIVVLVIGFGAVVFAPFASVTKGAPIATYSSPRTALVVIDIQKDMTEKDGKRPLNLAQTDSMIPIVNSLIQNADKKGWLVIYITHEYVKNSPLRLVTQDFLLEGKPGAAMDPRLLVNNQNHFIKHTMDAFSNEEFDAFLQKNQVNHLMITGMAAEECVDRTCQGALNRKYKVTILGDAISGMSDDSRKKKIADYKRYGAEIAQARAFIDFK